MRHATVFCLVLFAAAAAQTRFAECIGGSTADHGYTAVETSTGDIVLVGRTHSFGAGGLDFMVSRLDSLGGHIGVPPVAWTPRKAGVA